MFPRTSNYAIHGGTFHVGDSSCTRISYTSTNLAMLKDNMDSQDPNTMGQINGRFSNPSNSFDSRSHLTLRPS